jgi:HK97 family phage portal protein
VFENGRPAQMWPMHPSRVSARRPNEQGEIEYYVTPPAGPAVHIPASRMFHLRGLSSNGVWGLSPVQDARDTIGLGMAGEAFASGFFVNGARPSMVLQHPGTLSEDAYERLKQSIDERHTGLTNAQRTSILEEGMTAHTLSVSPEDAQFIEQRKFAVEEIARMYRVHPHKIGVMEGTQTYASVEQANIDHVVSTVRPWAVRWEQQISASLIPADDDEFYAELLVDGLLRGDTMTRFQAYQGRRHLLAPVEHGAGRHAGATAAESHRPGADQRPQQGGVVCLRQLRRRARSRSVRSARGASSGARCARSKTTKAR